MVQEGKNETMPILVILLFFAFRFLIKLLQYQFWFQSSYLIGTPTFKKKQLDEEALLIRTGHACVADSV